VTGEAAGAAMVSAPTCRAPETLIFSILGLGYLSDNFVADAPVQVVLSVAELYVNHDPAAPHNQYSNPAHHAIAPSLGRAIGEHRVFTQGKMCYILAHSGRRKRRWED